MSQGYNYSTTDDHCDLVDPTDVIDGASPDLGPLVANGGATATMLPESASPLLDAIPATVAGCTGTDQRGITRPQQGACDIGSVEVEAVTPTNPAGPAPAVDVAPQFTG